METKFEIFENFLKLKAQNPEKYTIEKKSLFYLPEEKNRISKYLLEQKFRLFKNAIQVGNDNVVREIVDTLSNYIFKTLQIVGNKDVLSEIMDTPSIHGNFFSQFLEVAIQTNDNSKYRLLQVFPGVLQYPLPLKKFREEYMENFICTNIFRSNEIIVDNDDFDLFKDEIHIFSLSLHLDPLRSKQKIENELPLSNVPFHYFSSEETTSFMKRRRKLLFYLRFILFKNFFSRDLYENFKKMLQEFFDHTEKSCDAIDIDHRRRTHPEKFEDWRGNNFDNLKERIRHQVSEFKENKEKIMTEIENDVDNLHVSSLLYKTFFDVGWYLFFCREHENIDVQKYLKELWTHTTPEDSITRHANESPVSFDIKFVTLMFLYGGKGDTAWKHFTDLRDFHDAIHYIYYYYLLLLTYSRMEFGRDLNVSISNEDTKFELEEKYKFLNDFIREGEEREESQVGGLIEHIDKLIAEAEEWNNLIHFKLEDKEVNAEDAFKGTKEWIKGKVKEFKERKDEIEIRRSIDKKR